LGFLSLSGVVARRVDATVLLAFSFWFAVCRFCQAGFSLDLDKRRKSKKNFKHSINSKTKKNCKNKPSKMPLKMAGRLRGPNSNHRDHER